LFSSKLIFAYILINSAVIFFLLKKNFDYKYRIKYQIQSLGEKFNVLSDQKTKEEVHNGALRAKILSYNSLKEIVEEINEKLDLSSVADTLTSIAFTLISNHKGTCILHLVDYQKQKLGLFKAKKEEEGLIIKAKEGDIFDHWVLKHGSSLFIEDVKNDFRFDTEKFKSQDARPVASLISSPLITGNRLLGILRLDNHETSFYSQNDSRLLQTICGLGAVAIENALLFQETQNLAIHDSLTSLFTKSYFLERLKEECKRAARQKEVFSLLMIDIDFFKKYNDSFGHTAGDYVLKNLGSILTEFLKDFGPIISRFGGEEFCVIIPNKDQISVYAIACDLRKAIEEKTVVLRRQKTNVTVSIGVAAFPADAIDEEGLIIKADKAMYKAKQSGRNKVVVA
jgi:diguanylate cyclase (GGDEF)-like protein